MRRDWSDANVKRGPCRVCGETTGVELAHVTGREHDPRRTPNLRYVRPDSVVPLCGPVTTTTTCHSLYDRHLLDLLPYLYREEQVMAVADLGLERAYRRVCSIPVKLAERAAA